MTFIFACTALIIAALAVFERRVNLRCEDGCQSHVGLFAMAMVVGLFSWAEYSDVAGKRPPEIARGKDGCVVGDLTALTMASLRDEDGQPVWLCSDKT